MTTSVDFAPWWSQAACRDHDEFAEWPDRIQVAWCHQCLVQTECLFSALREEGQQPSTHRAGVRGGYTPTQRRQLGRLQEAS